MMELPGWFWKLVPANGMALRASWVLGECCWVDDCGRSGLSSVKSLWHLQQMKKSEAFSGLSFTCSDKSVLKGPANFRGGYLSLIVASQSVFQGRPPIVASHNRHKRHQHQSPTKVSRPLLCVWRSDCRLGVYTYPETTTEISSMCLVLVLVLDEPWTWPPLVRCFMHCHCLSSRFSHP